MVDDFANRSIGDFTLQERMRQRVLIGLYRATQNSLHRIVLFKVITLSALCETETELLPDFQAYLSRVTTLEHIHLQAIYGAGVLDENHFYVVGRMIAGNLFELLQTGALPLDQTLDLALQITSALTYLHSRNFVHGSLSPQNIYIGDDQNAYINDLEATPIIQVARSLPELEVLLDNPFYSSVEQLQLRPLDSRSDIYAFGAILYHMVTGKPPFCAEMNSFENVLERKALNQLIAPRLLNPLIPLRLEQIILQALRANPDERFADVASLGHELKEKTLLQARDKKSPPNRIQQFMQQFHINS